MTKERELLSYALRALNNDWDVDPLAIIEEIRAYLAAEKGKQEEEPAHKSWCASLTQMLMSNPPQPARCNCMDSVAEQRKPLSFEEIEEKYNSERFVTSWNSFLHGVRFAEKHHGIGGGDE